MTWRHGILRDLHAYGLKRLILKYIEQFLSIRHFVVKAQNYLSNVCQHTNGVPNGSVLAVTLFTIKINSIAKFIP